MYMLPHCVHVRGKGGIDCNELLFLVGFPFFKPCIASHCCIAFGDGGDLHVRLWNCAVLHACPLMHMVVVVVLPLSEAKAKARMALGGDKRRV